MRRIAAAVCAALVATAAQAADNYSATFFSSDDEMETSEGYATLGKLIDGLAYGLANGSASQSDLSLRGVGARLVDSGGPCCISLAIPSLGITQDFSGPTYTEVVEQIRNFLTKGPQASRLQRESARNSPFDPVAGNPSSLMARIVAHDFASAFFPFASNQADDNEKVAQAGGLPAGAVRGPMNNLPGLGLQLGLLRDGDRKVKMLSVPLSFTMRSDLDPRRQLSIFLPLAVADVDGARTTQGTLGAAVRLPLATNWALSTSLGYSILDAKDLGTAAKMGSFSMTSSYVFRGQRSSLGIGNMIGYYRTLSGTVSGISTGSGVANTVFRNGLLWSMPASWAGFGSSVEYTLVNTQYTGTALYLKNYTELGASLGSNKRADSNRGYWQGGLSYLFSSKTKGVTGSWSLWF